MRVNTKDKDMVKENGVRTLIREMPAMFLMASRASIAVSLFMRDEPAAFGCIAPTSPDRPIPVRMKLIISREEKQISSFRHS